MWDLKSSLGVNKAALELDWLLELQF